jgi:hypothetical protein
VDNAAQAKAREMLRQKEAELNSQATNTPPAALPIAPTPAPAVAPAPAAPAPAPVAPVIPPPAPVAAPSSTPAEPAAEMTPDQLEKAREATRAAIASQNSVTPPAATAPAMPAQTKAEKKAAAKQAKMNPEMAPSAPAPVYYAPGSKEARLYELLQRYKHDEVTPAQYHEARAKILAEP